MIRSVLKTVTRGASCVAAGAPRGLWVLFFLLATPRSLLGQSDSRPPAPVLAAVAGDSMLTGLGARWSAYNRGDRGTLWLGSAGLDRVATARLVLVLEGTPRPGDAWLIGAISGAPVYDGGPNMVLNRDSLIVFDWIGNDYGWLGSRVVIWVDIEHRRTLASSFAGAPDSLRWSTEGDSLSVEVLSRGTTTRLAAPIGWRSLRAPQDAAAGIDFRGRGARREITDALTVLPGEPVVFFTNGRFGRLVGGDTIWTAVPAASDSLRRVAWTSDGTYQEYEWSGSAGDVVRDGDHVFAGCGFYAGEGANGIGGLVEFTPSSGQIRVFRWPEILHYSAGPIASQGDSVWVALYGEGEGETYPGGILVADTKGTRVVRQWFDDVVLAAHRVRGTTLVAGRRSLGLLEGTQLRRWLPLPGPRGNWVLTEAPVRDR